MQRHVTTRWLSLLPAITRITSHLKSIKSYFYCLNADELPNILVEFVWCQEFNGYSIVDMYLFMTAHLMNIFHQNIQTFERNDINSTNLYDIMCQIRTQLKNRLEQKFFGAEVKENLKYFPIELRNEFLKSAKNCYNRAIIYLTDKFDFDNSIFKRFSHFNLEQQLHYEEVQSLAKELQIKLDFDSLFDEINQFNDALKQLTEVQRKEKNIAKFKIIIKSINCPNILKIIEYIMAIPIGNDFVERVFSHLFKIWTDDRNRLSITLIKAEICIKNNFKFKCSEFKEFIKNNTKCLISAKSNKKYNNKHK